MTRARTLEDLTPEQQEKLKVLLAELRDLPTSEAIMRSEQAIGFDPAREADRKRIDTAAAGSWAFDRMLSYLQRLRTLNEERKQIGAEARQLLQHPYPTRDDELEAAAAAWVRAPMLAGQQEVVANFFCVSVQHIRSLLGVVAKSVGYEIPRADLDYLDTFRHLRNHFEHWYDRLPGEANEVGLMTKTVADDGEYRLVGRLEVVEGDQILVAVPGKGLPRGYYVDLNDEGVGNVERIVRETTSKVRELTVERVRDCYVADPRNIPSPESLDQTPLIKVSGRRF